MMMMLELVAIIKLLDNRIKMPKVKEELKMMQ